MATRQFGPYPQGGGQVRVDLGFDENFVWHEIAVSILDATGNPVTTGITGTLSGAALKRGADHQEAFIEILNLANDERSWDPELSRVAAFFFEDQGLNAGYQYLITVNSWGDV